MNIGKLENPKFPFQAEGTFDGVPDMGMGFQTRGGVPDIGRNS